MNNKTREKTPFLLIFEGRTGCQCDDPHCWYADFDGFTVRLESAKHWCVYAEKMSGDGIVAILPHETHKYEWLKDYALRTLKRLHEEYGYGILDIPDNVDYVVREISCISPEYKIKSSNLV